MEFFFLFEGGFKNNVYKYFPCILFLKSFPKHCLAFFIPMFFWSFYLWPSRKGTWDKSPFCSPQRGGTDLCQRRSCGITIFMEIYCSILPAQTVGSGTAAPGTQAVTSECLSLASMLFCCIKLQASGRLIVLLAHSHLLALPETP